MRPETTVRTVWRTSLQYRYSSSAARRPETIRTGTRTFQRLSCCSRTYGNPYWYSYNRSVAALPPSARDCTYRTAKVTFILHLACLPPASLPACLFPSCLPACLACTVRVLVSFHNPYPRHSTRTRTGTVVPRILVYPAFLPSSMPALLSAFLPAACLPAYIV